MSRLDPTPEEAAALEAWLENECVPNFKDAKHIRALIAASESGDDAAIREAVADVRADGDPWELVALILEIPVSEAVEGYGHR